VHWIVVGAGAAGCAVTAELVARPDNDVTLLEAGPTVVPPGVRSPSFFDALAEPGWTFPGGVRRGRGLGGSSAVNGMVAGRGWAGDMPIETVTDDELGPLGQALLAAAPDAAPVRLMRRDGTRVTAADHFLSPLPAGRVALRGDATVGAVSLAGHRAVGVVLADGTELAADRVVLCAGAIGTPAILLRSGITAGGVGEGLRNHAGLPVVLRRRGDVDEHSLVIGSGWRRRDVDVLALEHLGPDEPEWGMLLAVLMTTSSTGRVTLDAADGAAEPLVEWSLDPSDRARLARAGLRAAGLAEHPAFATVVDEVVVGEGPAGVFHWASTCAIGRVLDERGAVAGHDHLYVADAAAFAEIPVEHLLVPTIAQARRLARRFV